MAYLVGIDLGSTSLKAVIYRPDGTAVASASRPTERFHPSADHPEWTVWQPEQIWGGTAAAIAEAVAQVDDPSEIAAVAVTGMGMDGLPIADDGAPLYPFISWLDPRTTPQLDWWIEHIGHAHTYAIGGNPLWAINSALRIRWMMEHEPAIIDQADKWLLIEDYVNFMLCGVRATDYSMASCTMLFDQTTLDWSGELLAAAGIGRDLMPLANPSGTRLGTVHRAAAEATGLPQHTPVVLGGHDHLCGALPVGAFEPGVVLDVTGTWEIVSTPVRQPVLTETARAAGLTMQAHVARGCHGAWASTVAAESLEWFRAQASDTDDWAELMARAAASAPGAGGALFLPHVAGCTCPVIDPRAMGVFAGLRASTTRGDLTRAVIEGLDYQFREILCAVETILGGAADRIVAVGGAVRNEFWMQNKADVTGRVVTVPAVEEATPLGAAMLAGIGVGLYADEADAYEQVRRAGREYEPDAALAGLYEDGFTRYQRLYPALADLHHTIADGTPA